MSILKNRNNVITYTVNKAINSGLSIGIQNGEVVVKAPWYVSKQTIQQAVEEKRKWIVQKLKEYDQEKKNNRKKDMVVLLGEYYQLRVNYTTVKKAKVMVGKGEIEICLPTKYKKMNQEGILTLLINRMYATVAEQEMERAMEKTRILLGFAPEDYEIKELKDKIAMCDETKKIIFDPSIVKQKREIIDYIVLHEYCHLKYKNHSKGFYKVMERYMPEYKSYEKRIEKLQY